MASDVQHLVIRHRHRSQTFFISSLGDKCLFFLIFFMLFTSLFRPPFIAFSGCFSLFVFRLFKLYLGGTRFRKPSSFGRFWQERLFVLHNFLCSCIFFNMSCHASKAAKPAQSARPIRSVCCFFDGSDAKGSPKVEDQHAR